jgi:hypothetical protein
LSKSVFNKANSPSIKKSLRGLGMGFIRLIEFISLINPINSAPDPPGGDLK